MKNLTMTMVCLVMALNTTFAQVKRTFKDNTFAQTTVVIKEDLASDQDVLNEQFDLDEFAMDQQIRITTEDDLPVALKLNDQSAPSPKPTAPLANKAPDVPPATAVASIDVQQRKAVAKSRKAVKRSTAVSNRTSKTTQKVKVRPRSRKVERTTPLSGSFRGERSSRPANKRVRLKKKKRVKRHKKSRCYKF